MPTEISDDVLLFGGFALMHASYSISDVPAGELLVPFVIVESDGQQYVHRFESYTQEEAIANAKRYVDSIRESANLWAFARENAMRQDGQPETDVISIDVGRPGIVSDISVVQPFHPNNGNNEFRLLPGALVAIDGMTADESDNHSHMNTVLEGVGYHPSASLWSLWSQP